MNISLELEQKHELVIRLQNGYHHLDQITQSLINAFNAHTSELLGLYHHEPKIETDKYTFRLSIEQYEASIAHIQYVHFHVYAQTTKLFDLFTDTECGDRVYRIRYITSKGRIITHTKSVTISKQYCWTRDAVNHLETLGLLGPLDALVQYFLAIPNYTEFWWEQEHQFEDQIATERALNTTKRYQMFD
jgi:hypothetical protein